MDLGLRSERLVSSMISRVRVRTIAIHVAYTLLIRCVFRCPVTRVLVPPVAVFDTGLWLSQFCHTTIALDRGRTQHMDTMPLPPSAPDATHDSKPKDAMIVLVM